MYFYVYPPIWRNYPILFQPLTNHLLFKGLKPPTKGMVEDDIFKLLEVLRLNFHLFSIPIFILKTDAFH